MARPLVGDGGYTLIELIIVIIVIGITLALALPSVSAMFRTTDSQRLAVESGRVWRAVMRYRADAKGQFPPAVTAADLVHPVTGSKYIDSWPQAPASSGGGDLTVGGGSGTVPPTSGAPMTVNYVVECAGFCGWLAAYGEQGQVIFQRGVGPSGTTVEPMG